MIIKIAAGVALGIFLLGIAFLVLLTVWVLWSKWMESVSKWMKKDDDIWEPAEEDSARQRLENASDRFRILANNCGRDPDQMITKRPALRNEAKSVTVDEDYYTEEDFDLPEMDKDIQAKQMEQEVKERIKAWFAENDIEMQEEE